MAATLLAVDGLVAGYDKPVIGPLSFNINPGDIVGLWGANGCGKSTLLRAIAGNARIIEGSIEHAVGLRIAWQVQQPVRLDEMPLNGHDYLRYAQAGSSPPPERMKAWLDRRIDTLSGGQFQLLAVWAVLAGAADLVLLDEPTNNLDPEGQQVLTELLHMDRSQRALLVVSHERGFLESACTHFIEVDM